LWRYKLNKVCNSLLIARLVVRVSSQLRLLSTVMILGLEIGKTIQTGWIVQIEDFGDNWSL